MPERKLQRLDNFSLSKDFERENLICWRFSVCQLNTLSAESPFRVIKHFFNVFNKHSSEHCQKDSGTLSTK